MNLKRVCHLLLSASLLEAFSCSAMDLITVDPSVVVVVNARRQGINENYLMDSERERLAAPPRTTAAALQEMAPGFMRYPGGGKSQSQFWSVPPWTNSQPTLCLTGPDYFPANDTQFCPSNNGAWVPGRQPLTFDEFMANCRVVGAQANIPVCYSAAYCPLSANDARPTLQQEITNAVEWVRYANVTQGYDVKYWTLGNETDISPGNPGAMQYTADVVTFSKAMKAVDPTIKFCVNGFSADWFAAVLTNAAAYVDCLDVHEYPAYGWGTGYDVFLNTPTTSLGFTDAANMAISAIQTYAPTNGIQVILTETSATDWAGSWPDINDLGHAIVAFEIMGENLLLPQVQTVEFWNTRWINNDLESQPLGTTNLLTNPGFESGLAGWGESWGTFSITSNASEVHGGSQALRVTGSAGSSGLGQNVTSQFTPGGVYTLSAWAQVNNTANWSGGGITFYLGGTSLGGPNFTFTKSDYTQYSITFAAPAAFDYADAWCDNTGDSSTVLDVDDFNLVTGSLAPANYEALSPKNTLNPTGRALAIWGQFLQKQMVSATSTAMVRAYASATPTNHTLTIFLENKDTNSHNALITLTNYQGATSAGCWVFSGSGPTDLHPTWTNAASIPVISNTLSLTLAPVSISVLALPGPPWHLGFSTVSNQVILSWNAPGAALEQADLITGPWTTAAGNPGSPYTNAVTTVSTGSRFFRLRQ